MDKAILRFDYSQREQIDSENGVVRGCRLAEVNRVAVFAGKDGKPREINIRPQLIDELLSLAVEKGRLDAFWTHDRLNSEKDPLHDKVGVWRNFRKDESGNLIADLQLAPTEYREHVLWAAKEDPQGVMTSLVFDYTGGKEDAKAMGIYAADLVSQGAATTALLSAWGDGPDSISDTNNKKPMDIKELLEAMKDPDVLGVINGACKAQLKAQREAEMAETVEDTAPAEAAMSILPEDKKDEDKALPVAARLALWGQRASNRIQAAALAKVSEEASVKAIAALTGKIGNGTLSIPSAPDAGKDAKTQFDAKVAELTSKGVKIGAAVTAVMAQHPDLYEQSQKAIFVKPVKL